MSLLALFRRARVTTAVGTLAVVLVTAAPAAADSSADARVRADEVLAQVQAIQARVQQAEAQYDATLAAVAAGVTGAVQAERARDEVAAAAAAADEALDNRVRGLYMSGGPLALYATLLTSADVTDLQDRVILVDHVVSAQRLVVEANTTVVSHAERIATAADRTAQRRIATERDVAAAASRVESLLAEQQALLDQARARVAQLEAVEAAEASFAAQQAAYASIMAARIAQLQVLPPSPLFLSLYHHAAATCPGLSWTVLAAIGQVESGHGRNPAVSSAGAMGPMQFLPSTFRSYAVDGDGDGVADIMSPADAIYTAARYLCANGAGRGADALARAIWHYNHADWYVQMVLKLAGMYAG